MSLNLINTIADFLRERPEERFTAKEIANYIYENYPEQCKQKQKKSKAKVIPLNNTKNFLQQITSEIGARRLLLQKKYPKIKITETRPREYYFLQNERKTRNIQSESVRELELYTILSKFLLLEYKVYSKRIDEKRSINSQGKNGNKWLHPDIVGVEDLSNDWHNEIKHCSKKYSYRKTKLWSFEVKKTITRSNIREVFFQTVSNSSWANSAYLVTQNIEGTNTEKELNILSSLHGIGVIILNINNFSESQFLIQSKEKSEIDWHTINRIAEENKDFLDYIKQIRQFYQTDEIKRSDWFYEELF
jgi:hypothetical protein